MRVLGLIPARGGSKGIPRKNLHPVAGQPLLWWTIQAAKAATLLDDVAVSTEDAEIAAYAESQGVRVIKRPQRLAKDESPVIETMQHAVRVGEWDAVCLLQPTNPCRQAEDIDACVRYWKTFPVRPHSVVSLAEVQQHPAQMCVVGRDGYLEWVLPGMHTVQRQVYPPVFLRDGGVYVVSCGSIRRGELYGTKCLGLPVPAERSIRIDTPADLARAEKWLTDNMPSPTISSSGPRAVDKPRRRTRKKRNTRS